MSELRCLLADNRLVRRKPIAKAKPKTKAPPPPIVVESAGVELPTPARAAIEEQAGPAKKRKRNRAPAGFCEPPRSLVVGIAAEVHALVAGTHPHWPISDALWACCNRLVYLNALANSGIRIALDGTESGQVTRAAGRGDQAIGKRQAIDEAAFPAYEEAGCAGLRRRRFRRVPLESSTETQAAGASRQSATTTAQLSGQPATRG